MAARRSVLGLILVLGILGTATAAADGKDASPRPEATPSKTAVVTKEEARKEKNRKLLDGMSRLSNKIDGLLKKSPDFSGGS